MTSKQAVLLGAMLSGTMLAASPIAWSAKEAAAKSESTQVVRLAELEIDPARLDAYKSLLQEEIGTSIRVEPGVISLYAVAVKDHPEQIRLFERYASPAAYQAHLQTPHFKRYKEAAQSMVRSLRLVETTPVLLASK